MKLNLGAGPRNIEGYTSVDIMPGADITLDLENDAWIWEDNSIDEILAEHIIEHLRDFKQFMNNCHRILKDGGVLVIETPHPLSSFFWQDPTHIRGYTPNTFTLYCMGVEGTLHSGLIPWKEAITEENIFQVNGVEARIIRAVLIK